MSDSDSDCPMDVEAAAEAALAGLLPEKSKKLYEAEYKKFETWRMKNKIPSLDEKCLLAYFSQELANQKPSSKWTHYSMLKATINMKMGIDISSFKNLVAFLKRKSDGFRPKKSKILTQEEIFKFLKDADDNVHLVTKVALIIGVYGACRREEITKLALNDIEDMGESIKITIPNTKTKIIRQFVMTKGSAPGIDMLKIFRTYAQMRPADTNHSRFFVGYRLGKCTKQAIGINTIGKMPKVIAEFLKLPSPAEYTGHCFRRSSASLLADSGVDISVLKRHGGWKSSNVAEGYVENSLRQKKMIAGRIMGDTNDTPGTSEGAANSPTANAASSLQDTNPAHPSNLGVHHVPEYDFAVPPSTSSAPTAPGTPNPVQFNNLSHCTINFYQNK